VTKANDSEKPQEPTIETRAEQTANNQYYSLPDDESEQKQTRGAVQSEPDNLEKEDSEEANYSEDNFSQEWLDLKQILNQSYPI